MQNISIELQEDTRLKSIVEHPQMIVQHPRMILHVSKKILARESIFRNIDCNISHEIKRNHTFLTEEQIKTSSIYEKLLQRIQKVKQRQEDQIKQHQNILHDINQQIKLFKTSLQEDKIFIWEGKNQLIELQQLFNQQMEQYNALCEQIRTQQCDHDNQNYEEDEGQSKYNDSVESQNSENSSNNYDSQNQTFQTSEKEDYSKPSCSIKYFVSNQSISSDRQKKNLLITSELEVNAEANCEAQNQQQIRWQSQQSRQFLKTDQKILSFKKSQKMICE